MILIVAGTADGRQVARAMREEGCPILMSTATGYGEQLAGDIPVRSGALDQEGFKSLITERGVKLVVDASHPFAAGVSQNLINVCGEMGLTYIRYERPETASIDHPLVHRVNTFEAAACLAGVLGDCIFLATGSNTLQLFVQAHELQAKRLVARVLPVESVIKKCRELGFKPADIAALQGPFGVEINKAMFRHYGANVLVSKESGIEGGTDAKLAAALELGIPVVLVQRPVLDYPLIARSWPELRGLLGSQKQVPGFC